MCEFRGAVFALRAYERRRPLIRAEVIAITNEKTKRAHIDLSGKRAARACAPAETTPQASRRPYQENNCNSARAVAKQRWRSSGGGAGAGDPRCIWARGSATHSG